MIELPRRSRPLATLALAVVACPLAGLDAQGRGSPRSDRFESRSLDASWLVEDPDGDDTVDLGAREGWLRIRVSGPHEDSWSDGRGGAPFVLSPAVDAAGSFSVETLVDLATANGGYPAVNSIGGLVVRDPDAAGDSAPFLLTFGVQHGRAAGTEVIAQRPGVNVRWEKPGANAVALRLERSSERASWRALHRAHRDDAWRLLVELTDAELVGDAAPPKRLEVGLFAKTWDPDLGAGAVVDFAYFGEPEVDEHAEPLAAARSGASRAVDLSDLRTFSVIGKERTVLDGHGEAELMRHEGRGALTHMWFGGDWPGYDRTRIRVYVDGEREPRIDMELGLGHGYAFGGPEGAWGTSKVGRTGQPSGVYNAYKIPFGAGVRVTAQRFEESPDGPPFWWIIRGTENLPVSVAGVRLPDAARLELHRLDGHEAQPYEEFDFLDVDGAGALYQVTMAGDGLRDSGDWKDLSYLEAIVRAYIDGSKRATELSSGLEDYFLGTYYFNRGAYQNGLAGLTHLDAKTSTFSAYRFHDEDPVFFRDGLRLTCRCGELLFGRRMHDAPPTLFTVYTWVYRW